VMMPGLNGFAVLDRIRTGHCHADVPVIMVTAVSDTEEVVRAFRAGADDYVTKPINFQILNARLQSQLRRRQHEGHASQVVLSSLEQDLVERWLGCWDCQRELLRSATEAPLSRTDIERLQAFEPLHLDTVRPLLDAMLRVRVPSGPGDGSDEASQRP
jgi:two-component system, sensor histidine kinase ChiS